MSLSIHMGKLIKPIWVRCTEIGVGLTSFGGLFMMLGIMLFFDGALVFFKWPTIGVLVEMFGFLNLFGCVCPHLHPTIIAINDLFFRDFFPVILTFLRQLPFVGQFLNLPYIRHVCPPSFTFCPNHLTLTRATATCPRSSWIV